MKIILASKSPRRKELLGIMNIQPEIIVSEVDESFKDGETIEEQAKELAYRKARAVFDKTGGDRVVIGSDTMVIKDSKIYEKPIDREDAIRMISNLKNSMHQVITSIAVIVQDGESYKEIIDYDIADVYIKDMTDKEIIEWVDSGNAYDKAGAYGIQGTFSVFVEKIVGNYFTVVGLPTHKVYEILKGIGVI